MSDDTFPQDLECPPDPVPGLQLVPGIIYHKRNKSKMVFGPSVIYRPPDGGIAKLVCTREPPTLVPAE